jgi:hypothetical protein
MTVTIQSGPPWLSLDASGMLIGTPPTPGSYTAVLASNVGAFNATLTVTIVANALGEVLIDSVTKLLTLGNLVLSFQAEVGVQEPSMFNAVFTFSALAETLANFGAFVVDFAAAAGLPNIIPQVYIPPLPVNTQELTSGSGLADSYPYNTNRSSLFSYRVIKPNFGPLDLSVTGIVPHPGSNIEIYAAVRSQEFTGSLLNSHQNLAITSSNWSRTVTGAPPGIYYIDLEIFDNQDNALSSFTVTGTWDTTLSDTNEPNFSRLMAQPIALGQSYTSKLTANDEDWFYFSTTGVDQYDLKGINLVFDQMVLQTPGSTPGIKVDVYQVNSNRSLGFSQPSPSSLPDVATLSATTRRVAPQAPDNFVVRVKYLASEYSSYRLTVDQFAVLPDAYEPSDSTFAQATLLTNGVVSPNHTIEGSGDEDWYRIFVSAPAALTVSLTNIVSSSYLLYPGITVSVFDNSGSSVEDFYQAFDGRSGSYSGSTSSASVSFTTASTLPTGTYRIQVTGQTDAYDLTATW